MRFLNSFRLTRVTRDIVCVCVSLLLACNRICAEGLAENTSPFALDLQPATPGKPVVLSRTENGLVTPNIIYSGKVPIEALVYTTAFSSESGSITIDILSDCNDPASKQQPQPWKTHLDPKQIKPICLFIQPLPTAATYTGRLIITAEGVAPMITIMSVARPEAVTGPSPFQDLMATSQGNPATLTRPENGMITPSIFYSGKVPIEAQVNTTVFTSESGSITAEILSDRGNPASAQLQPVKIRVEPNTIVPLCLFFKPLPITAKYTGRLIISAPGSAPMISVLSVTGPAVQGTLVLDHTSFSQAVFPTTVKQAFSGKTKAEDSVILREKTGNIALQGVSVRLEQLSTTPDIGFDLHKNIDFWLNGQRVNDLDQYPPASGNTDSRTIQAGGKSVVKIKLHDLLPGDYAATLRFTSINAGSDDAQKFQINIHSRASVVWAVLCMVFALILTFIVNKVVIFMRRRASFLRQIRSLEDKASIEGLTPPEVRVRAVLSQAKRLSTRFWLTSPEEIEASVDNVKGTVSVLDKIYDLRQRLKTEFYYNHPLIFRRVDRALGRILLRADRSELTDPELQNINLDLTAFNEWLVREKSVNAFWEEFLPDLQSLVSAVQPKPSADQAFNRLKQELGTALQAPKPSNIGGVEDVYGKYATLKILWQNRDKSYLNNLIQAQSDVMKLLELADNFLWDEIKKKHFRIRFPEGSEPEAFEVLTFIVETDDAEINDSYLFRHKITYEWKFTLEPSGWWKGPSAPAPVTSQSLGPSLAQYFRQSGTVTVEAQPRYKLESASHKAQPPAERSPMSIGESTNFKGFKIRAWAEAISWLIAAILAIPSGLLMFYFQQPSWGTLKELLRCFVWIIARLLLVRPA